MATITVQNPVSASKGRDYRGMPCPFCNEVGDGPWVKVIGEVCQLAHVRCIKDKTK